MQRSSYDPIPKELRLFFQEVYSPNRTGASLILFYPQEVQKIHGAPADSEKITRKSVWPEGSLAQAWLYTPLGLRDPMNILLIFYAAFIVALGAVVGNLKISPVSAGSTDQQEARRRVSVTQSVPAQYLSLPSVIGFFVAGSCMLTILYFTISTIYYAIVGLFVLGACEASQQLLTIPVWNCWKCTRGSLVNRRKLVRIYNIIGRVRYSDIIAVLPGALLGICYIFDSQRSLVYQDLIALLLCVFIQRSIQLPSLKLGSIFLSLMFFFDIFWVFFSDRVFGQSVMIHVAQGAGGKELPMLIEFNSWSDDLPARSMLGFGDIAIPGFLITYNLACDKRFGSGQNSLFLISMAGYVLGLLSALVAVHVSKSGQPALLYLVPTVMVSTFASIYKRQEFWEIWDGTFLEIDEGTCQDTQGGATPNSAGLLIADRI